MKESINDKFEKRLMEETGKLWVAIAELRAEMQAGFAGIHEKLSEVYREISRLYEGQAKLQESIVDLHKSMVSQTKWILSDMLGIGCLFLAVAKYF
ncbi:hypothetical protein [Leptospira wolffii]|uniref:hypothetical protein n=1 Tax=Leptospira wolffii TaxID=409998 RepID=UPI001FEF2C43|nr:hypothetical protein [Leptospira wolffii]